MATFVRRSDKAVVKVGRWTGRNIMAFCAFLRRDCQGRSDGPLQFLGEDGEMKSVPLDDFVVLEGDGKISIVKPQEFEDGYHSL
jgi:hypothetical protein